MQVDHESLRTAYRQKTDGELIGLAGQAGSLSDEAKRLLSAEMQNRGLAFPTQSSSTGNPTKQGRLTAAVNRHPLILLSCILAVIFAAPIASYWDKAQRNEQEDKLDAARQRDTQRLQLIRARWVAEHQATILAFQPIKPGLNRDAYLTVQLADGIIYEGRLESGLIDTPFGSTSDPSANPADFTVHGSIGAEVDGTFMKLTAGTDGNYRDYRATVVKLGH